MTWLLCSRQFSLRLTLLTLLVCRLAARHTDFVRYAILTMSTFHALLGNPMPVEMLQTSSSNIPQHSSSPANASSASSKNQKRQDRSCKGKRYLEMINENKTSKRAKSNSVSGGTATNDSGESSGRAGGSASAGSSSGSKWVSGNFDLERK